MCDMRVLMAVFLRMGKAFLMAVGEFERGGLEFGEWLEGRVGVEIKLLSWRHYLLFPCFRVL